MGGILFPQHTTHTHTLFSQTGLTLLLLIFGDWIDWFSFQYIIFFLWWSSSLVSKCRTQQFYLYPLCIFIERLLRVWFSLLPRPNVYYTKQTLRVAIFWGSKGLADCCSAGWLLELLGHISCSSGYILARAFGSWDNRQRTNKPNRQIERNWEPSHPRTRRLYRRHYWAAAFSAQLGEF